MFVEVVQAIQGLRNALRGPVSAAMESLLHTKARFGYFANVQAFFRLFHDGQYVAGIHFFAILSQHFL